MCVRERIAKRPIDNMGTPVHTKHPTQDSINSRLVVAVKVLFDRFEPTNIVVCVRHEVHIQNLLIVNRSKLECGEQINPFIVIDDEHIIVGPIGRGLSCVCYVDTNVNSE